ncbi:MAG: type II CAAX endopeptidase family protein [Bacillota bacterium]|nr:type II CAAX endopeptidase family protein [Bacillota bacterium]
MNISRLEKSFLKKVISNEKFINIILCIVPLVTALLIQIAVLVLGKAVHKLTASGQEMSTDYQEIVSIIAAVICIITFSRWYKKIKHEKIPAIKSIFSFKLILLLVFLGVCLELVVSLILVFLSGPGNSSSSDSASQVTVMTIIFEVLFAPISDELIFRGVMLNICRNHMPLALANILQAIAFGIYHGNLVQGIYALVLGLFLGYLMIWFGSLLVPVFLHVIINLTGNLMFLLPESLKAYGLVIFILSVIIITFNIILIKKQSVLSKNSFKLPTFFRDN